MQLCRYFSLNKRTLFKVGKTEYSGSFSAKACSEKSMVFGTIQNMLLPHIRLWITKYEYVKEENVYKSGTPSITNFGYEYGLVKLRKL